VQTRDVFGLVWLFVDKGLRGCGVLLCAPHKEISTAITARQLIGWQREMEYEVLWSSELQLYATLGGKNIHDI